jgi:hypothetical protein
MFQARALAIQKVNARNAGSRQDAQEQQTSISLPTLLQSSTIEKDAVFAVEVRSTKRVAQNEPCLGKPGNLLLSNVVSR